MSSLISSYRNAVRSVSSSGGQKQYKLSSATSLHPDYRDKSDEAASESNLEAQRSWSRSGESVSQRATEDEVDPAFDFDKAGIRKTTDINIMRQLRA